MRFKKMDLGIRTGISLLLVLMLLLGSCTSFAETSDNIISAKTDLENLVSEKITTEVKEELAKDGDFVEILVYLKDRVDPQRVAQANEVGKTTYERKISSRRAVVNALMDKAEITQKNIVWYLKQEEAKGNVKEFKSYYIVNMVYVRATKDVVEDIAYMSEVEKIYLNKKIELDQPIKSHGSSISSTDDGIGWNIKQIGANQVWNLGVDGSGVVVGIIDSGADWTHEALKEKWRGYNSEDPRNPNPEGNWFDAVDGRTMPYDIYTSPHGSHVLGTILGQDPEGENKIGVAPGAKWIAAKAFTEAGGHDKWLLDAGEWMLAPGGNPDLAPDIINNSWGSGPGLDEWYRDMVKAWRGVGIVPIFAAGNEPGGRPSQPGSIETPSNYPESFAVAATDKNNKRGDFSRQGPSVYGDMIKPEISAPGVNIRSSIPGGYEGGWDGTSMAAPHVTGTVALLLSANRSLTVDYIEDIITNTAIPLTDTQYSSSPNYGYGYGLVNAFDAVSEVLTGTGNISGKVLIEGEDLKEPSIIHEPFTESFMGSDIPIEARIIDDISIVNAEIYVKQKGEVDWNIIPMTIKSGDHKDGIYIASIETNLVQEPGFIYKIKVEDYAGNMIETEEYSVSVKFGIVPDEYEMDFEILPAGWKMGGDWQWGEPVEEPIPYSGVKVVGTRLDGKYSRDTDSVLATPPIDLRDSNLDSASLRFHHWYDIEDNNDLGVIYITPDFGRTWNMLEPEYTGHSEGWREGAVDLGDYIGSETPIMVVFRFMSDYQDERQGWYIDDVRLVGNDDEAPSQPTELEYEHKAIGVVLNWKVPPEGDVGKYKVYRSEISGGGEDGYKFIGESTSPEYLDKDIEKNKAYYYVVKAIDFSGNESGYSEEIRVTTDSLEIIFFENFEEDDGGFYTGGVNNSWQWGIPMSGPNSSFTGSKVWATNLTGDYIGNSNCWIESPEIQLPADSESILAFTHWYDTESPRYDRCHVYISASGSNWINVTPGDSFGGRVGEWTNTEISLGEYGGEIIKIRFVMVTDNSTAYSGWYIDNVAVVNSSKKNVLVQENRVDMFSGELTEYHGKVDLNNLELYRNSSIYQADTNMTGIPVDAVVTVVETGKSVNTDVTKGTYSMQHAANKEGQNWTLRTVAYGYYPQEIDIHLEDGETVEQNYKLQPLPKGSIVGKIVDRHSNEPVVNAKIRVKEDPYIEIITSDENGNFMIQNVFEGTYTLRIINDEFEPGEVKVKVLGDEASKVEVSLKRFVGYDGELVYDDGTSENALTLKGANSGFAVRMSPDAYGKVMGVNIKFYNDSWPTPGGDEIGVAIYDSEANGLPGKMVGDVIYVNVVRGEWNYIDLSDISFSTNRDFFIATYQKHYGIMSPAVCIDEDGMSHDRSYIHVDGGFQKLPEEVGNVMMRGVVKYSLDKPQIINLSEIFYTSEDTINVIGRASGDCDIYIYVNGERIEETTTQDGKFSLEVELPTDEVEIYATSVVDGRETEPSDSIKVIKDKTPPVLNVDYPSDGQEINQEMIHVTGNVVEKYFDKLLINGEEVQIEQDGNFDHRIFVNEGENIIIVKALDLAGNQTVVEKSVYVSLDSPTITEIKPEEDIVLEIGEELEISFDGETGGTAYFRIVNPLTISSVDETRIEMTETYNGHYEAIWIVPQGIVLKNAYIEVEFTDAYGNRTTAMAPGRITTGEISVPLPMENLPANTVIIGEVAFDIRYLNNNKDAQMKLIDWHSQGKEIYIKIDEDRIVNIRGEIVEIDELPEELTYYDANGEITKYAK